MNENIDLTKILKDCPKGTTFYHLVYEDVSFEGITDLVYPIQVSSKEAGVALISRKGRMVIGKGECVLFPSKDQRDWSKFTAPWYKKEELIKSKFKVGDIIRHKENNRSNVYKIHRVHDNLYVIDGFAGGIYIKNQDQYELVSNKFDPKTLKSFDKVLVRDSNEIKWKIDFFSHCHESKYFPYKCIGNSYKYCISYNDDTKHLVGTKDEAPEFYRYWEN